MKFRLLPILIIIVLIAGCVGNQWEQSTPNPSPTIPPFQPGIWDKPIIIPPNGTIEPTMQSPFLIEIDVNSSYGFEEKHLEYGRPIFVLARGKSATINLSVFSQSNRTQQISLSDTDVFPSGVTARLKPEYYILQPNETAKFKLNISVSSEAPISTPVPGGYKPEGFIGLLLKGDGWSVGKAFYLKII